MLRTARLAPSRRAAENDRSTSRFFEFLKNTVCQGLNMRITMKRDEFLTLLGQARTNERKFLRQELATERRKRFQARMNVAKSLFDRGDGEFRDEHIRRRVG